MQDYLRVPYITPTIDLPTQPLPDHLPTVSLPALPLKDTPLFMGGLPISIIFPEKFDFFHRGYPLFYKSRHFKKFFPEKFQYFQKQPTRCLYLTKQVIQQYIIYILKNISSLCMYLSLKFRHIHYFYILHYSNFRFHIFIAKFFQFFDDSSR